MLPKGGEAESQHRETHDERVAVPGRRLAGKAQERAAGKQERDRRVRLDRRFPRQDAFQHRHVEHPPGQRRETDGDGQRGST